MEKRGPPKCKYPRRVYAAIAIWVFILALFALVGPLQLYGTAELLALLGFAAVGFILWGEGWEIWELLSY